jgi:hypothetical protein
MTMRRIILSLLLAAGAISSANAAQYIVEEARGIAAPAVGSVLDPTKPLVLKQGQHLTLISDSGQTINIDGPFEKAANVQGVQLAAAFGGLVVNSNSQLGKIGTVRSGNSKAPLPAPWLIDATSSGSACLLDGSTPTLWRPVAAGAADVVITPSDRSWRAEAKWVNGADRLALKGNLGVHGDAAYFVSLNGSESAITISSVPSALSNDQMRAAWMVRKGCDRQAEALLRASK